MQELPALVFGLTSADHELAFLGADFELIEREAGHRKRDAQTLRIAVVTRQALNVVGRVAVGRFADAVERALDLVEAEKKRSGQRRYTGHCKVLSSDFDGALSAPPPAGESAG